MIYGTTKELSDALGVSMPTVFRWVNKGMPRRMEGLQYRFDLDDVLDWLETQTERHQEFVRVFRAKKKPPAETGGPSAKCNSKDTTRKNGGAR
jgi:excisionase family DNA binding protein